MGNRSKQGKRTERTKEVFDLGELVPVLSYVPTSLRALGIRPMVVGFERVDTYGNRIEEPTLGLYERSLLLTMAQRDPELYEASTNKGTRKLLEDEAKESSKKINSKRTANYLVLSCAAAIGLTSMNVTPNNTATAQGTENNLHDVTMYDRQVSQNRIVLEDLANPSKDLEDVFSEIPSYIIRRALGEPGIYPLDRRDVIYEIRSGESK